MSTMTSTNSLRPKPIKKYVLQQSNSNLNISHENEDQKLMTTVLKNKEMLERENQSNPQKKSDAKKLRSIRHDLSSLKKGVVHKAKTMKAPIKEFVVEKLLEEEKKKEKPPRSIISNDVTNKAKGSAKKLKQIAEDILPTSSQKSPAPGRIRMLNIARRNARERNRVKLVNEGFVSLRNRIPEYISDIYSEENGKKATKKISKVETLRMALDYIRYLESLLDFNSVVENQTKNENQPWETPSSVEYSPQYQQSCMDSPGTSYDQTFEYQDRIFYEYELNVKDNLQDEKRSSMYEVLNLVTIDTNASCVDGFKYYETFNKIKKSSSEVAVEEEEDLENVERDPEEKSTPSSPKDVIKKEAKKKTVLPSITETFNKGIPIFF